MALSEKYDTATKYTIVLALEPNVIKYQPQQG